MSRKLLVLLMDVLLTVVLLTVCVLSAFITLPTWVYVVLAVVLVASLTVETVFGIKYLYKEKE